MVHEKANEVFVKVKLVMSREVITIDEKASVKEAVDIMNQAYVSCIIATKKEAQ